LGYKRHLLLGLVALALNDVVMSSNPTIGEAFTSIVNSTMVGLNDLVILWEPENFLREGHYKKLVF